MMFRDLLYEVDRLRREVDQVFGNRSGRPAVNRFRTAFLPGVSARTYPMINIRDDGERFHIEALAPGVDPASLKVTANRDGVTISGEKPGLEGLKALQYHRSERSAGRFSRAFTLPSPVNADDVTAEYKHGVLYVSVPRAEEAKPRAISVAVSN